MDRGASRRIPREPRSRGARAAAPPRTGRRATHAAASSRPLRDLRRDGTHEAELTRSRSVLLVEQMDATGAAPADARARVLALRHAGYTVETVVLQGDGGEDLQYSSRERPAGAGIETLAPDAEGLHALAALVRDRRPDRVLWAGCAPGGGSAASAVSQVAEAWWWPTGHAPAGVAPGPLPALQGFEPPCGGSALEPARAVRNRLSLWDGPFVLLPALPSEETASAVFEGFANAASDRDEVDLVVLGHPGRGLLALSRAHGIALRTHFVGPAPREAEAAWLCTASTALVPGDAMLSGGLLLRALGHGCAPVAVGAAAAPIADWLEETGCAWSRPRDAEGIAGAIEQALERADRVQRARARGRETAAGFDVAALTSRLARPHGAGRPSTRAA